MMGSARAKQEAKKMAEALGHHLCMANYFYHLEDLKTRLKGRCRSVRKESGCEAKSPGAVREPSLRK